MPKINSPHISKTHVRLLMVFFTFSASTDVFFFAPILFNLLFLYEFQHRQCRLNYQNASRVLVQNDRFRLVETEYFAVK